MTHLSIFPLSFLRNPTFHSTIPSRTTPTNEIHRKHELKSTFTRLFRHQMRNDDVSFPNSRQTCWKFRKGRHCAWRGETPIRKTDRYICQQKSARIWIVNGGCLCASNKWGGRRLQLRAAAMATDDDESNRWRFRVTHRGELWFNEHMKHIDYSWVCLLF